ncbi:hypothetical protein Ancab_025393 [Ancistrocladus abbreviatus]
MEEIEVVVRILINQVYFLKRNKHMVVSDNLPLLCSVPSVPQMLPVPLSHSSRSHPLPNPFDNRWLSLPQQLPPLPLTILPPLSSAVSEQGSHGNQGSYSGQVVHENSVGLCYWKCNKPLHGCR